MAYLESLNIFYEMNEWYWYASFPFLHKLRFIPDSFYS